jgi:hypothetical protein
MSQQDDQIKQLEESNQELKRQIELQAKQIEALKSTSAQSDEERFAPYQGKGWGIIKDGLSYHEILEVGMSAKRHDYYAYPTKEQAEWEHKATQVRRKLQRICAVLGPAKSGEGYGISVLSTCNRLSGDYEVKFERTQDARKAEQILGDDLKYLDWNSSPEAQDSPKERDAREGRK